mmetsp:Transcript_25868/g.48552  ORF Transcript_25868/g.48552 Transcript_25868/m.48552 type:complete len:1013 (-) Transcript_25868:208-3246(-)
MEGLVGDAFQADERKSDKQFGLGLQKDESDIVFGSDADSAPIDPKCNSVCLMKSDKRVYRNMIAVSKNFICYTVKGNLLRVIDSEVGEKVLLRGHESPVLDVRFSPADENVLCSVDAGEGGSSHVHLWRLTMTSGVIDQTLQCSLPLRANNVKSHPLTPSVWGISCGNQLGLLNPEVDAGAQTYDGLKCHLPFKDDIIDFCFSPDGLYIAVITGSSSHTTIGVFKLSGGDNVAHLQTGQYTVAPNNVVAADPGQVFSGVSFISPHAGEKSAGCECVLVTLAIDAAGGDAASSISKLQVWSLARGKRSVVKQSVTLTMPATEPAGDSTFPTSNLTMDTAEEKFITVSNQRSTIVACVGISDDATSQRLYHCTFFNLKFAVSSVVNSTVFLAEKDGTARQPTPHVKITCFQDQRNGQNAIQQYHVPSKWVFQPPAPVPVPVPVADHSPKEKVMDSSTFLKNVLFSNSPVNEKSESPPIPVSTVTPVPSTSSSGVGGISILSKEGGPTSSLPVGSFPDFALISESNQTKDIVVSNTSDSTNTELPSQQVDIGVKSKQILLSALKVRPSVASTGAPSGSDASRAKPEDVVKPATQKPPTVKSRPVATPIHVPTVDIEPKKQEQSVDDDEDDWEKASISISRSQPSTPLAADSSKDESSLDRKFNELLLMSRRMEEKVASLEEKTVAAEKQRRKGKAAELNLPKALGEMKAEIAQEVAKGVEQVQLQSLAAMVEHQSQQAVANILASEKWRQQLSAQMSVDLRKELTPAISQVVRSSVSDNLKGTIIDTFRSTFETTIVPAYEAGSQEMFSQLRQAFSQGMDVMKEEHKKVCEKNRIETAALRSDVVSLKNVVSSLEARISNLTPGGLAPTSGQDDEYETDFKQLFHEGRIGAALEVAVESKVINNVLWVLKQQAQALGGGLHSLLEESSDLCVLCTAQQLSADLAAKEPEEGVKSRLECLKEIVMYLIDDHLHEVDVSVIIASTLANLKSAEAKHTLVGAARTDMKMLCSILSSNF